MEHRSPIELLAELTSSASIKLSEEQLRAFQTYLIQLQLWNRSTNLTSITEAEDIIAKHFFDSLAAFQAETMAVGARVLDVGSGAGFPGIPLHIARPDLDVTLLEPAQKKCSFLHFIVGSLQLDRVKVCNETFERFLAGHYPPQFDYIVTRALNYDVILGHGRSLLNPQGKVILYLSQRFRARQWDANWNVQNEFEFELPIGKGKRSITVIVPKSERSTWNTDKN